MDFRRKGLRKKSFDYSSSHAYFVTICTKDKQRFFWKNGVVHTHGDEFCEALNETGQMVYDTISDIPCHYNNVEIDRFVIMPNHVHLIVRFISSGSDTDMPNLSDVIHGFKAVVTRKTGRHLWQKSFYDRIIRNQKELDAIREYIYNNPTGMPAEYVPFNDCDV